MTDLHQPTPTRPTVLLGKRVIRFKHNNQVHHRHWSTREERTAIFAEMRRLGLKVNQIAKHFGLTSATVSHTLRDKHPELSRRAGDENEWACMRMNIRPGTYDVICRYALQHGTYMTVALDALVEAGAKALNFNPDAITKEKKDA